MRRAVLAFWIGVAATFIVLVLNASSTTWDADVVATEANAIGLVERVDQGSIGRILSPGFGALGTVRFTKRSWGLVTTYSQELTVLGARIAQAAGSPLNVRVSVLIPGAVVGTNADGGDGRALVWSSIPSDAPLWVRSRSVSWPVLAFLVAALGLTAWIRKD